MACESWSTALPTISVIIPAYNAGSFITRAIRSVQAQTTSVDEILVVDDASQDDTVAVVKALADTDPRIRLIQLTTNQGPGPARNAALDAARTDWVAILDADDAYLPDRLGVLLEVADRHEADLVGDNLVFYDIVADTVVSAGLQTLAQARLISLEEFVLKSQGGGIDLDFGLLKPMLRLDFLNRGALRYPTIRHGEDFDFAFNILLNCGRYVVTPHVGYLYTQRTGSVSGTSSGQSRTKTDYAGMADHTLSLLALSRVKCNPGLERVLRGRLAAIRRLDAAYRLRTSWRERRLGSMLRVLADNPVAGSVFLDKALTKIWTAVGVAGPKAP